MATTTRKRTRGRAFWIIAIVVLLATVLGAVVFTMVRGNAQVPAGLPQGWQEVAAERGTIDSTVSATGNVEPQAQADLSFEASGIITEVLVKPGDRVSAGEPLARLDTSDLELTIDQSQAELTQAQAELKDLLDGVSPQEVAEAEARVAQARSQLQQTVSSVSQADIAAARAELESARAELASLESGPETAEVAGAREALERARNSLEQSRTDLSAAKERARIDLETKANALRNAQDEYSRIYWDNRALEKLPGDLPQEQKDREEAALRSVKDAEAALEAARVAYEQAKQEEITTLQTRQVELERAQAEFDKVMAGAKPEELARARASVQRAQASLNELTGANRASNIEAQRQGVTIAQSALDKLLADPNTGELARAEAAVVRADIALKQAQRNLAKATLRAPFAGTIARIDMRVGEQAQATATIALVDLSSFHIDVPVDELDVAQVVQGQQVRISLDALPDRELSGTVTNIEPLAEKSDQGTTSYNVTVTLDSADPAVRPGMTAVVQIVTSEKNDAVLIPRRAVQSEGGKSYVLIYQPGQPADPRSSEPPGERREVTLGLSNSEFVEIVNGLEPGEKVLVRDVVTTFNPAGD